MKKERIFQRSFLSQDSNSQFYKRICFLTFNRSRIFACRIRLFKPLFNILSPYFQRSFTCLLVMEEISLRQKISQFREKRRRRMLHKPNLMCFPKLNTAHIIQLLLFGKQNNDICVMAKFYRMLFFDKSPVYPSFIYIVAEFPVSLWKPRKLPYSFVISYFIIKPVRQCVYAAIVCRIRSEDVQLTTDCRFPPRWNG